MALSTTRSHETVVVHKDDAIRPFSLIALLLYTCRAMAPSTPGATPTHRPTARLSFNCVTKRTSTKTASQLIDATRPVQTVVTLLIREIVCQPKHYYHTVSARNHRQHDASSLRLPTTALHAAHLTKPALFSVKTDTSSHLTLEICPLVKSGRLPHMASQTVAKERTLDLDESTLRGTRNGHMGCGDRPSSIPSFRPSPHLGPRRLSRLPKSVAATAPTASIQTSKGLFGITLKNGSQSWELDELMEGEQAADPPHIGQHGSAKQATRQGKAHTEGQGERHPQCQSKGHDSQHTPHQLPAGERSSLSKPAKPKRGKKRAKPSTPAEPADPNLDSDTDADLSSTMAPKLVG
ncbi:uncharacterized protein MYCGRDRAFT_97819 [Zymoseptoria tritici IPO323]|uniref:Uncharacterized protein n=1 Tax=Zymoseptoria tritici (strain CBS 115943 / IPO323) TaxID=336722 RepID=F9XRG9_ZYMTI|nr:uncharacterized protein MYCGRDRAFT_97819 [Zymoseptoria tritici IPO323]EGP82134.1 hypothetical protein MYCGRDRAFT_97819 [Zymoseptoria tritici IPO323]